MRGSSETITAALRIPARRPWRAKEAFERGKQRVEWRTFSNNEDSVGHGIASRGAPRFFGIDYRGVLPCIRGDLTRPTPFQFLPAKGFSRKAVC